MPTAVGRLLDEIHPDRTRNALLTRMDETINRFRIGKNRVDDAIAFAGLVGRFVNELDMRLDILPSSAALPEPMQWQRAVRLLRKVYGPHGEVAAFEIQRAGAEGGLYGVLKRLALAAAEERIEEVVSLRVDGFCQRLSAEEYLATGGEYLSKYGHLLPAEIQRGFATRARLSLAAVLKQHHLLLVQTTRVGR